jgi:hypothetical protein
LSFTKRQFCNAALTELGIVTRGEQMTADEAVDAAVRLDAMMAEWDAAGIHIGYPLTSGVDDVALETVTAVPAWANGAVITNLALQLAPMFGKQAMPGTMSNAKRGYTRVLSKMGPPPSMQLPGTMPAGAGNKPWLTTQTPFIQKPDDPITVDSDSVLDFE